MFNKTMIALTAAAIVGSASVAFSYDDVEGRLGDKYPFLDQSSRTYTARNIGAPYVPALSITSRNQAQQEDVENRIADRYPSLEPNAPAASAASILRNRVTMRDAGTRTSYADPESRIGDKYPFLDQVSPVRGRAISTARLRQPKQKV